MSDIFIFKREEKKYLVTDKQRKALMKIIGARLSPDEYGRSTVMSMYLDTPDFRLVRNSLDARCYKEKLRVRSYGTPGESSKVFFELKKKYDGTVYKRRVSMTLAEARAFIRGRKRPFDSQIMRELDWAMRFYGGPTEAMLVCYERDAFFDKTDPSLRLTFDANVRYRCGDGLDMTDGDFGKRIIPDNVYIMEIKTCRAMPLWLADALSQCGVYPASFSKYGASFRDLQTNGVCAVNSALKIS